jgi:hypothetical protein
VRVELRDGRLHVEASSPRATSHAEAAGTVT